MREFTFSVEEEVRRSVLEDYGQLAIMEQTSWRQKSRALRIQEGDRNPIEWLLKFISSADKEDLECPFGEALILDALADL
ncbi:hypothetical protein CK203_100149 [Vitis vinifera]|uniref:Uncharacterized protein n=1 Tax=Vitis vinifera TaxID=29760 RepID=A0A438DBJ5_VITVI|nr:hypothetical protein CK203_100149 [Vitis vinifera]